MPNENEMSVYRFEEVFDGTDKEGFFRFLREGDFNVLSLPAAENILIPKIKDDPAYREAFLSGWLKELEDRIRSFDARLLGPVDNFSMHERTNLRDSQFSAEQQKLLLMELIQRAATLPSDQGDMSDKIVTFIAAVVEEFSLDQRDCTHVLTQALKMFAAKNDKRDVARRFLAFAQYLPKARLLIGQVDLQNELLDSYEEFHEEGDRLAATALARSCGLSVPNETNSTQEEDAEAIDRAVSDLRAGHIIRAKYWLDSFGISDTRRRFLLREEIVSRLNALSAEESSAKRDALQKIFEISERFSLSQTDFWTQPSVQEAAKNIFLRWLPRRYAAREVIEFLTVLPSLEFYSESREIADLVEQLLRRSLKEERAYLVTRQQDRQKVRRSGDIDGIFKIVELLRLRDSIICKSDINTQSLEVADLLFKNAAWRSVQRLYQEFQLPEERLRAQFEAKLIQLMDSYQLDGAIALASEYKFDSDFLISTDVQRSSIRVAKQLLNNFGDDFDASIKAIREWLDQFGTPEYREFVEQRFKLKKDLGIPKEIRSSAEFRTSLLTEDENALFARRTHGLSPREYNDISAFQNVAVLALNEKGKPRSDRILTALLNQITDQNIVQQLRIAVDFFGAETMLRYMNRPDLSRHDAVFFFSDVIDICKREGLSAKEVGAGILDQIAMDDASYEDYDVGNSYAYFAVVIDAIKGLSVQEVLREAESFSETVPGIKVLIDALSRDTTGPFSSWRKLKKYKELATILQRKEVLEKLRHEPNDVLRKYIEYLAFHPNLAMDKVLQFWETPERFLDARDSLTPVALDAFKRPSALLKIPFLGLTGMRLRDALTGDSGTEKSIMDRLQALPAMTQEYKVGKVSYDVSDPTFLYETLVKGIGMPRKQLPGNAKRPKKLLGEVKRFCEDWSPHIAGLSYPLTLENLLLDKSSGATLMRELSSEARSVLSDIIFNKEYGVALQDDRLRYRARLGWKSDPSMAVAGNDTACCMPLGSGKSNHYQYNLICAQFVIEQEVTPGAWRTAAQSVVTLDRSFKNVSYKMLNLKDSHIQSLGHLLEEGDFSHDPCITCDNIEASKNARGSRDELIQEVYEKFWTEYLRKHAAEHRIDPTKVVVGTGYTSDSFTWSKEENTFVSLAPLGYSDNDEENSYILPTGLLEAERIEEPHLQILDPRNIFEVAYLQARTLNGRIGTIEALHEMQNIITGLKIANESFGRPNLSFLHKTQNGIPHACIVAYEGEISQGNPVICIKAFLDDGNSSSPSERVMTRFIEAVRDSYVQSDSTVALPPFILPKQYGYLSSTFSERIAGEYGMIVEIEEITLPREEEEDDDYDEERIPEAIQVAFIAKDKKSMEEQKEHYRAAWSLIKRPRDFGGDEDEGPAEYDLFGGFAEVA